MDDKREHFSSRREAKKNLSITLRCCLTPAYRKRISKKMDKKQIMSRLKCSVDSNLLTYTTSGSTFGGSGTGIGNCYDYWYREYYPGIIRESYPVYIQDRAKDKGKQAFEVIKMLSDKKFINLKTVKDFIDAMDLLIKIL